MIAAMGAITTLGFIVWAHLEVTYNMWLTVYTTNCIDSLQLMACIFTGQCKVRGRTQTITRNINKQFIDWFVGFSEGDGGFYYSNNGGYECLFFKIRQKNRNVLDYIHSNLNLGSVTQPGDGYYTYAVSYRPEILILFQLFNGRLLLK